MDNLKRILTCETNPNLFLVEVTSYEVVDSLCESDIKLLFPDFSYERGKDYVFEYHGEFFGGSCAEEFLFNLENLVYDLENIQIIKESETIPNLFLITSENYEGDENWTESDIQLFFPDIKLDENKKYFIQYNNNIFSQCYADSLYNELR